MSTLKEIYDKNDFPGINKLFRLAKNKNLKVTLKEVKNFVNAQKISQLYKKPDKPIYHPITTTTKNFSYQMDLLDMTKFYNTNSHYRYILIMIDIFTRKAYAVPLKNKSAKTVLEGIKKCFDFLGTPKILASDNGSEFQGVVSSYLQEKDVLQKMNEVGDHHVLGIIDRFSKTLKNILYKHFTASKTTKWVPTLPQVIENYNNSPHSTLKNLTPNEAEKFDSDVRRIHSDRVQKTSKPEKFGVGDIVRVAIQKNKFSRSYDKKWTSNTYKIVEKKGYNYVLTNGKNYRANQLQKVSEEDTGEQEQDDQVTEATHNFQREKLLKREDIKEKNIVVREKRKIKKPARYLEKSIPAPE